MIWIIVSGIYALVAFFYFIHAMNGGEGTNDFLDGLFLTPIFLIIGAFIFLNAFFGMFYTVFLKKTEKPWMKDDQRANP